jgi:pyruvate/2-oxoglutarate dehydrogenase complex dihydrolipoamide acyltransferase (E2) component
VLIGNSATAKPVTLTNNQSVALTNINITISGPAAYTQVNTCGTSIPTGGQCTITVTFAPTTSGAQTGTVNISDNASNSPQSISLQGSGTVPVILSPASLSFGMQNVGTTSAAKNITVKNNEKVTVTFTSVNITGADSSEFAQTDNCTSLASGATCTVSVTFTPSGKGAQSATLTLTDSAINSPQTATLSGTGEN